MAEYSDFIDNIISHYTGMGSGSFKRPDLIKDYTADDITSILPDKDDADNPDRIKGFPDKKLLAAYDYYLAIKRSEVSRKRTPKDYYENFENKDISSKLRRQAQMLKKFQEALPV
jgi:hypothetical protein